MPPKARVLDDEEMSQVEALASVLTSEQIADYFGIARTTFYDIMSRQEDVSVRYKRGRAKAIGLVAKGLLKKAQSGDTTSAIFYLKTQAGWRETDDKENSLDSPSLDINFTVNDPKADVTVTNAKS